MDLDLQVTERTVYSYLDWIGDIGGLLDGLKIFFLGLTGFLNFNFYNSYMVSQLFRIDENDPLANKDKELGNKSLAAKLRSTVKSQLEVKANDNIDYRKLTSAKMLFFHLMPERLRNHFNQSRFKACKRGLKYRLLEDGEKQFKADIDVVKIIRDQRWIMAGMKALLLQQSPAFR